VAAVPASIIPPDEPQRMAAVKRCAILDTPADGSFDRLTAIAARRFNVPISIISIVDSDRIWFKSHPGLGVNQINREPGLCASAILPDAPHILLVLGRTKLPGGCGMDRDTAVAAQANGDRKRDQFASLVMEVTGLLTGAAQGDIALDGIGVELAKAADPGDELLTVVVPVVHMHDNLLFRAIWDGDWEGDGFMLSRRKAYADRINEQGRPYRD
jgi:hypothetical protein